MTHIRSAKDADEKYSERVRRSIWYTARSELFFQRFYRQHKDDMYAYATERIRRKRPYGDQFLGEGYKSTLDRKCLHIRRYSSVSNRHELPTLWQSDLSEWSLAIVYNFQRRDGDDDLKWDARRCGLYSQAEYYASLKPRAEAIVASTQ